MNVLPDFFFFQMTAQQWLFEVAEGREVRVSNLVLWEVDFGFLNVVFALQSFPIDVQWPKKKAKHKKEHDIEWYSSTSHFNINNFDEKKVEWTSKLLNEI